MSTNKEKVSWLTGLLTGWGIKESWAKVIAGAVIGALVAAGILTQPGCGHSVDVTPSRTEVWETQRSWPETGKEVDAEAAAGPFGS